MPASAYRAACDPPPPLHCPASVTVTVAASARQRGGSVTRFRTSTESAREVAADLLIVPAFTDGDVGPGLKEVGLAGAYGAARLHGKKGEDLLVARRDGDAFKARNVLVVGAGAKADLDLTAMRRILGRAAASTRRFPSVATTMARAFGARHAAEAGAGGGRAGRRGRGAC